MFVILSALLAIFLFIIVFGIPIIGAKSIYDEVKKQSDSAVKVTVSKHSITPKQDTINAPDPNAGVYGAATRNLQAKKLKEIQKKNSAQ